MWDVAGRSPKVSWLKQHSAPTAGLSFSPLNDKIIATVGLDKKLYTFDSGTKKSTFSASHDAPFSSLAFRDDGWVLAAGASDGKVVFYDVRGRPKPFKVLPAYGSSEAVNSLSWQRSKLTLVDERTSTAEAALLGGAVEDSVLMPDPLPSVLSNASQATTMPGPRRSSSVDSSSFAATSGGSFMQNSLSTSEKISHRGSLRPGGILPRLHATRSDNFKDEMEVFSPLVDVQHITPSLDKLWNGPVGCRKDQAGEINTSFPFSDRKFTLAEGGNDFHPIFGWKASTAAKQDGIQSSLPILGTASTSKLDDPSAVTTPEAWGDVGFSEKLALYSQTGSVPSRFTMLTSSSTSTSVYSGLQDPSSGSLLATSYSSSPNLIPANLRTKDASFGQEFSPRPGHVPFSSLSLNTGSKAATGQPNPDSTEPLSWNLTQRLSKYAERMSTSASQFDGVSSSLSSPKTKKTGVETRDHLRNSLLSRSDTRYAAESGLISSENGAAQVHHRASQGDLQQGASSFTVQLFQHTLTETLSSFQRSMHEDLRNLHIEILRQSHMQETELLNFKNSVLDRLDTLTEEVQALRKENAQLRQLL